jgi:ATP-dependent DNA helicase RecQ
VTETSAEWLRAEARRLLGHERFREGPGAGAAARAGERHPGGAALGPGKSAVYQLAGLLLDGSTVVVSPTIALQHDQVGDLGDRAAIVNSTMTRPGAAAC